MTKAVVTVITKTKTMFPTLNIYWIFGTALMVWFLFIHSPIYLHKHFYESGHFDVPFFFHLFGAYSVSIVCIVNSLFIPTVFGGKARFYHRWLGRFGMVCGIISFVFGLFCSWWPYRTNLPDQSFSIAITIGGVGQILAQYVGYTNIRKYHRYKSEIAEKRTALLVLQPKNDLKESDQEEQDEQQQSGQQETDQLQQTDQQQQQISIATSSQRSNTKEYKALLDEIDVLEEGRIRAVVGHVKGMITLFILGCGIPSFIRLINEIFPDASAVWIVLLIVVLLVIEYRYAFVIRSALHLEVPQSIVSTTDSTTNPPEEVVTDVHTHNTTEVTPAGTCVQQSSLSL